VLYQFTCVPLGFNGTNTTVRWRRFRLRNFMDDLSMANYSNQIIGNNERFTVSDNGHMLTVNNSANAGSESVAFYFVPSFLVEPEMEVVTAETVIFCELGPTEDWLLQSGRGSEWRPLLVAVSTEEEE
jgi:hypothetical protein